MGKNEVLKDWVGERGDPRAPVVETFHQRGILLPSKTVALLRSGHINGNKTTLRLKSALLLEANDSSKKFEYYRTLGQKGIEVRHPQKTHPRRYTSRNFSEGLASEMDLDKVYIRELLRVIRADICYADLLEPKQDERQFFCELANFFLDVYTLPLNSNTSGAVLAMRKEWNGLTIEDFYRVLYSHARTNSIAIWEPFESEFVGIHYKESRNINPPLSRLDEIALHSLATNRTLMGNVELVRRQTTIPISRSSLVMHARVLVNGQPLGY